MADRFLAHARPGILQPPLLHDRTGHVLAAAVELAATSATRRRGLLGRDRFDTSSALIIVPCSAIHTAFMRFPIDVLFVDRQGLVLKIVRHLRPWRIAGSLRSFAVIAFGAGALQSGGIVVGDRVRLMA